MRKKSFLLLEVLIALLLVICCAFPLVTQPIFLFRKEVRFLEQLEMERLAAWTFTEIKEKLFKNEIPWHRLPLKNTTTPSFSLPPLPLSIPNCKTKQLSRSFTLSCRGEKTGQQEEIYRTLFVKITLADKTFSYRLTVQRKGKSEI